MRWMVLVFSLLGVGLAGCGQGGDEADAPAQTPPAEQPGTPADSGPGALSPEGESGDPAEDKGTGLGTEFGTPSGDVTDPSTGEGTGTTQ